jgi:hypothetical protein
VPRAKDARRNHLEGGDDAATGRDEDSTRSRARQKKSRIRELLDVA